MTPDAALDNLAFFVSLRLMGVDARRRLRLTLLRHPDVAILRVTTEYGWIIGIIAIVLGELVTLAVIGKADAALWPLWDRRLASVVRWAG